MEASGSCPFRPLAYTNPEKGVTVKIRKATAEEILENESSPCCGSWGRSLVTAPARIANCAQIFKTKRTSTTAKSNLKGHIDDPYIAEMHILRPIKGQKLPIEDTAYVTASTAISNEMLRYPRNGSSIEEKNLFKIRSDSFLKIYRKMFPGESITEADNLLTCTGDDVGHYRDLLIAELSRSRINSEGTKDGIVTLVQEFMQSIPHEEMIPINKKTDIFTVSVIAKLLLGHEGPYEKLTEALLTVFEDLHNQLENPNASVDPKYNNAYETVRQAVNTSLESGSAFVGKLAHSLSPIQVKTTIALLFIAGQEGSSILISRCLYELGRNPQYQQQIHEEILANPKFVEYFEAIDREERSALPEGLDTLSSVKNAYREALRIASPAHFVPREANEPLIMKIYREGQKIHSQYIPAGGMIIPYNNLAAHSEGRFEKANEFHPGRFNEIKNSLPIPFFGKGVHGCLGRDLIEKELMLLIPFIIWKYKFESNDAELKFKETIVLTYEESPQMQFTPRRPS